MLVWQLLGISFALGGFYTLYRSWRRKGRSWPLVLAGWGLLLISIVNWGQTSGIDKGPALGIVAIVLVAMIAVMTAALKAPVKQRRTVPPRSARARPRASVWHEGLAISASVFAIVVLGLIASVAACTAIFMISRAAGVEHTTNLTVTMFAFPVIWAALATYVGYSSNSLTKVGTLVGTAAVSIAILTFTMQGG